MPDDDERIESLENVLRDNGVGGPSRLTPHVSDPADWPSTKRTRLTRATWIALVVVLVIVVVIPVAVIIAARVT